MTITKTIKRYIDKKKIHLQERKKNIMEIANETAYGIVNASNDLPDKLLNRRKKNDKK